MSAALTTPSTILKTHKTTTFDNVTTFAVGQVAQAMHAARRIKASVNVWKKNPQNKKPPTQHFVQP